MYKKTLNISDAHTLSKTDLQRSERKGQDTDIYYYDEIDVNGNVVAKYVVRDSTCIYPPQQRTIQYQ